MTLSLAAVFIPVLFMSGIMGRLFHEFAVTIMVAILISGFVSLSLTPMLCSRFLKPPSEQHNALYRASERCLRRHARSAYGWTLARRHPPPLPDHARRPPARWSPPSTCIGLVPKGFIPNQDTGQLQGYTEAPQDISFDAMVRLQQAKVAAVLGADPNIEAFSSNVGHRRRPPRPATPGVSSSG